MTGMRRAIWVPRNATKDDPTPVYRWRGTILSDGKIVWRKKAGGGRHHKKGILGMAEMKFHELVVAVVLVEVTGPKFWGEIRRPGWFVYARPSPERNRKYINQHILERDALEMVAVHLASQTV